jgi:hypothetical protein
VSQGQTVKLQRNLAFAQTFVNQPQFIPQHEMKRP